MDQALHSNQAVGQVKPHLETTPIQFRTILVATDFSEPARQALRAAADIAQLFHSSIILAHAVMPLLSNPELGFVPSDAINISLETARDDLHSLITSEDSLKDLSVEPIVEYGSATTMVEELARDRKADLVVVGTHGASGLEKLALGSVAESIVHNVWSPVLVMGPHSHRERSPFRSIVFAASLSLTDLRPAQYATALAEHFKSRLTLLHVIERPSSVKGLSAEVLEDRLLEDMEGLLPKDAVLTFAPEISLEYGEPVKRIIETAVAETATLIVIGQRRRSTFLDHLPWLTLPKLVREARCGVLVVNGRVT